MSIHKSAAQAIGLGIVSPPSDDWTPDQLAAQGKTHLDRARKLGKDVTREVWLAGDMFLRARKKLESTTGKYRHWGRFQASLGVSPQRVSDAIRIRQQFETADEAGRHYITEAKILAGLLKRVEEVETADADADADPAPVPSAEPTSNASDPLPSPLPNGAPESKTARVPYTPSEATIQARETNRAIERHLGVVLDALSAVKELADEARWAAPVLRELWHKVVAVFGEIDEHPEVTGNTYGFHATDTDSVEYLLARVRFAGEVWEPCCGDGAISQVLETHGYTVHGSDLRDSDDVYGSRRVDALLLASVGDVVTNPPFRMAREIMKHLVRVSTGKVAALLPLDHQTKFAETPPNKIYVLKKRPRFRVNGVAEYSGRGEYGWYLWEGLRDGAPAERVITELVYI